MTLLISDKQTLKRCLKQQVRRAEVVETAFDFDVEKGEWGIAPLMMYLNVQSGSPLTEDACAVWTALDAMGMPIRDLARVSDMEAEYTREAYMRQVLDVMRARSVLVSVPLQKAEEIHWSDDRLAPLLVIEDKLFAPGRYGTDYQECARIIAHKATSCGAKHIGMAVFDAEILKYSMIPVCEDENLTLHIRVESAEQILDLADLLDCGAQCRMVVSAAAEIEKRLIAYAVHRSNLLVRLSDLSHLKDAIAALGTHFIPFSSHASSPEQMLGRWIMAKESIWQALCEAYLPLARAGYDLSSETIAADVERLFCGINP